MIWFIDMKISIWYKVFVPLLTACEHIHNTPCIQLRLMLIDIIFTDAWWFDCSVPNSNGPGKCKVWCTVPEKNSTYAQPCLFCCYGRTCHTVVKCITRMMTLSNGNIFRVTGPLWGEFTGNRWFPLTGASDAKCWCFLWSGPEQAIE